jgi:hypothetical protein
MGNAEAVGESEIESADASGVGELLTVGAGIGAPDALAEGSGVGDSVGAGESVGDADAVSTGASTVPRIGLSKSSANERGVTMRTQRTARAKIAFFIVDSGVLAMLARVMIM